MKRPIETWETCGSCRGDIPPEAQWGKPGERPDGHCPGHQRADGMCGAFATRANYDEER